LIIKNFVITATKLPATASEYFPITECTSFGVSDIEPRRTAVWLFDWQWFAIAQLGLHLGRLALQTQYGSN
jgi:hypothetical protein